MALPEDHSVLESFLQLWCPGIFEGQICKCTISLFLIINPLLWYESICTRTLWKTWFEKISSWMLAIYILILFVSSYLRFFFSNVCFLVLILEHNVQGDRQRKNFEVDFEKAPSFPVGSGCGIFWKLYGMYFLQFPVKRPVWVFSEPLHSV